jgi:hypothetical protein
LAISHHAATRNVERFPEDFMFRLTSAEVEDLRSLIVISSWGGRRYLPCAFTEHGILMVSNVLKSERAIGVSIQIIRVFAKMREIMQGYRNIVERVLEKERLIVVDGPSYRTRHLQLESTKEAGKATARISGKRSSQP